MRVLVWHWGRRGAGPRFAVELAAGLAAVPGTTALLSLAAGAEILSLPHAPHCDLPVRTYAGWPGLLARAIAAPLMMARLDGALARLRPDIAICAMPAPLDPLFLATLRRRGIPNLIIAHDAAPHAGDGGWPRALWDRAVLRHADMIGVLSRDVGMAMAAAHRVPILSLSHPPFPMPPLAPPCAHGGPLRVLSFGRLRAYKGLDLLAATARRLPRGWEMRVVGTGPETAQLATLRAVPGMRVENRWVAEADVPGLLGWADVVLLTHAAASQSGVAAAAIGAGRFVVATDVGGLAEQARGIAGVALCRPDADALVAALMNCQDAPLPARADPARAWQAMAVELLAGARRAGLVQRQPRAMAAASCSAVRSGPL